MMGGETPQTCGATHKCQVIILVKLLHLVVWIIWIVWWCMDLRTSGFSLVPVCVSFVHWQRQREELVYFLALAFHRVSKTTEWSDHQTRLNPGNWTNYCLWHTVELHRLVSAEIRESDACFAFWASSSVWVTFVPRSHSSKEKVNVYLSSLMMKVPDHVYVLG
jgi:hypothetical protein